MYSKVLSRTTVSVLGVVFVLSICIGLSGNIALADSHIPDECGNNSEFTTDFRLEDCKFKDKGENTYFILKPGYQSVLETPEGEDERERVVITVLHDKKTITLPRDGKKDRKIKTRVVEERESEWDDDEEEWVTVEISRNYFAICKQTSAVHYFGELSRECDDGFDEKDECEGGADEDGSWEAGVDGAISGLIMPGTILLGSKYFQEQAPPDAVDRGQIEAMGLDEDGEPVEDGECIKIVDTNPAEGPDTGETECPEDEKIYCPGVGLVQDEDLVLIWSGYI